MKMKTSSISLKNKFKALLSIVTYFTALASSNGQDPELTNFRTGIDMHFGDSASTYQSKGTQYAEEYLFFDKLINDEKIVYIKSSTAISLFHNSRNIAGNSSGSDNYEQVGPEIGEIVFKVDGDHRFSMYANKNWPKYTSPFTFDSLDYGAYGDPSTQVVGSTGDNGIAMTLENRETRYHRGMLDSSGDEWHTITFADNDSTYTSNVEFQSSDSKIIYFVVNPLTPCLTWRTTGDGQFYSTPPKTYFQPHIYDQTTYIDSGNNGTVSAEIQDINGNNVFYRIVTDPSDPVPDYIDAGSHSVILEQNHFPVGKSFLQYYYSGKKDHTKTRTVFNQPAYPSQNEQHGDRFWVDATQWEDELGPFADGSWWFDQWRRQLSHNQHNLITTDKRKGYRSRFSGAVAKNALVARWKGMNYKSLDQPLISFAKFAKDALLESDLALQPVGSELNTSNEAVSCRELIYRGYYDVRRVFRYALAYDILIGYYRQDQGYADGITPIEDHYLRDTLARWTQIAGFASGSWVSPPWGGFDEGGMWDTAHKTGMAAIAGVMPTYSTEYFGTCGLDGNETVFRNFTFPPLNYTWFSLYLDNTVTPVGFPDIASRVGVNDYMFVEAGGTLKWHDRIAYADTGLMGQCMATYYNLLKLFHPTKELPNFDRAMTLAANGELYGNKINSTADNLPAFYSWIALCNSWHEKFREIAQPFALALPDSDSQHPGKQANSGGEFYVLWYDRNLQLEANLKKTPISPSSLKTISQ